jgi:alpha-1,6-mannosyltransferase
MADDGGFLRETNSGFLFEGAKTRLARALRLAEDARPHLVDTTMFYAPRSGGVKRYLEAKRAWLKANRPGVRHTLLVPGNRTGLQSRGLVTLYAAKIPFGDGYRFPTLGPRWANWLESLSPTVIEAGDYFTPGRAALEAGQRLGVPVVGFCHSDPGSQAALHFGEWAKKPVETAWAKVFSEFDRVVAPSRYIAERLIEAGVDGVVVRPLGVDVAQFRPTLRDRERLLRELDLPSSTRLLVAAGRPAREKNVEALVAAVQKLGDPYRLLLIGCGVGFEDQPGVIARPYTKDGTELARILASADAYVHANAMEPFGLIVLEAMASGLPVAGVASGGVRETVGDGCGRLAASDRPGDLAEAIEDLFADDWERLSACAREHVVGQFSWDRVFQDLTAVYAEVAGARAFTAERAAARH